MDPFDCTDPTRGLEPLIGNTPLLAIRFRFRGTERRIYAKSENLNMTGSVKDRMALQIMQRGYRSGALVPGGLIVEATSGNTGISFAAIGRALGHPVAIYLPSWMSGERIALLRSFGARLELVTPEQGGFIGSIRLADELGQATEGAFLPHQFSNDDNCIAHETGTGPELEQQLGTACRDMAGECEISLNGEDYLVLPLRHSDLGEGYRLLSVQSCGGAGPPSGYTRSSRPAPRR